MKRPTLKFAALRHREAASRLNAKSVLRLAQNLRELLAYRNNNTITTPRIVRSVLATAKLKARRNTPRDGPFLLTHPVFSRGSFMSDPQIKGFARIIEQLRIRYFHPKAACICPECRIDYRRARLKVLLSETMLRPAYTSRR